MEMNVDELLEFCAYYQINKHATALTIETFSQNNQKTVLPPPKSEKNTRKKVEQVEHKKVEKVVKPKMQIVPRKERKESAPIIKQTGKSRNEGLDYFISHISGQQTQPNNQKRYDNFGSEEYAGNWQPSGYNAPSGTRNYQTFGKSNQNLQYETYESKMNKQVNPYSKGNFTERPQETRSYLSKLNTQPQQNNMMVLPQNQATRIKRFWENSVYQTRKNDRTDLGNLMYSPVQRKSPSPSNSILSQIRRDQDLSKSRSKQKKKNSERSFYNPVQLSSKTKESDFKNRRNDYQQSVLSNSFISNDEVRTSNGKKAFDDEAKRQTSTSYVNKTLKEKPIQRRDMFSNELDDGMQDIISHLASEQRNAPIAISLISRNGKM